MPEGRIRDLFLDMNAIALQHPDLDHEREPASAIERLGSIKVPTLVMWGDLDFPHVKKRAEQIAATITGAEAMEIPDTAHLCNLERTDLVNEHLHQFLSHSTLAT